MAKLLKYTKNNAFNRNYNTKFSPSYPTEMMVKLFSSNIYSRLIKNVYFLNIKKKML